MNKRPAISGVVSTDDTLGPHGYMENLHMGAGSRLEAETSVSCWENSLITAIRERWDYILLNTTPHPLMEVRQYAIAWLALV